MMLLGVWQAPTAGEITINQSFALIEDLSVRTPI
jgi:hypothetical protein